MNADGEVMMLDGQPVYLTNDIYVKNVEPFFAFLEAFKNNKLDELDEELKTFKKRSKFTRPTGSSEIANFDVQAYKQKLAELKQNEVSEEEAEQQASLAARQTTAEELEQKRKAAEENRKVQVQELESKKKEPVVKTNVISNAQEENSEDTQEATAE